MIKIAQIVKDVLEEKIKPSTPTGEVIKDFEKSDAPQFKGKSKEKKRQMAIAASLQAKGKKKKGEKKPMKECAECGDDSHDWTGGHDHEGFMAKSEVKDMIQNAVKLHNMLGENDQLPGWVSAYITLASDYIHSVTEHLSGKEDEEMGDTMPDQPMM